MASFHYTLQTVLLLGYGIDTLNNNTAWVTKPVVAKVMEVSEMIDSNIDSAYHVVDDQVLKPAKEQYHGQLSITSVATVIADKAIVTLSNRFELLVESADEVVEYWAPSVDNVEKEEQCKTFGCVAYKASKRIRDNANKQWKDIQLYSKDRLESIVPIDLIEYSKDMVKRGAELAEPVVDYAHEFAVKVSKNSVVFYSAVIHSSERVYNVYVIGNFENLLNMYRNFLQFANERMLEMGVFERVDSTLVSVKQSKDIVVSKGKAVYNETEARLRDLYVSLIGLYFEMQPQVSSSA